MWAYHYGATLPHLVEERPQDDCIANVRDVELVEADESPTLLDHLLGHRSHVGPLSAPPLAYRMHSLVHLEHKLVKVSPPL